MIRRRWVFIPCCALLAAALPVAAASGQVPYREQIEVIEIRVPVQVVRAGAPVRGLQQEDFRIVAGGKKREIVGFQVVDLGSRQTTAATVSDADSDPPLPARRHFMLLFDLSFARAAAIVRARLAALELIDKSMHPSDLVGVGTFSSGAGFRLLLDFTSDRRLVQEAILGLGLPLPIRAVAGSPIVDPEDPRSGADGRLPADPEQAEILAALEAMALENDRAILRHHALDLTDALGALADAFRGIEGRKQLIYLSEGFPSSLVIGVGPGATAEQRRQIETMNEAAIQGEVWSVSSEARWGYLHNRNQFEQMLEEFVVADTAVHSVDIGGVRAGTEEQWSNPGDDTLFMMADQTGGEFLRNFNNLNEAMGEILERTSVTYLLAFQLPADELDGELHKIKVRLNQRGRGMRVLHRPAYLAESAVPGLQDAR